MAFRNRRRLQAPILTEKHEITWSNLIQDASTVKNVPLIQGVEVPSAAADQVETGHKVNSIYIEFNLNGVDGATAPIIFHWLVGKNPGNLIPFDPILYDQINKKFILKRGMEMLPENNTASGDTIQTKRIFVVRIPPKLRRFDDTDVLRLYYRASSTSPVNFCGIAIYKEWK